jgi:hypothetical protein
MEHPRAATLIVTALKTVRAREGTAAALREAKMMLTACAAIIAHEEGPDALLRVLEQMAEIHCSEIN